MQLKKSEMQNLLSDKKASIENVKSLIEFCKINETFEAELSKGRNVIQRIRELVSLGKLPPMKFATKSNKEKNIIYIKRII